MTDVNYPIGQIEPQPLTNTVITPTTTLVDDTVALVDDTKSLTGSLVTPVRDSRVSAINIVPQSKIQFRR